MNSRAVSESATRRQPVSRLSHSRSSVRCRRTSTSISASVSVTSNGLSSRARSAALRCACSSAGIMTASGPLISTTCSGPAKIPSAVRSVAVPPPGTTLRRTSRVPSLVVVLTSVSPGRRAASASPRSARNNRNARVSSTSRSDSSVGPAGAQPLPGRGGLGRLALGLPAQQFPLCRSVPDLVRLAAPFVGPGLPELRGDVDGRGISPRRYGRQVVPCLGGLDGDGQMTCGAQSKCRAPEPVRGVVIWCLREPSGEHAEVRRAVRTSRASLVEQGHRVDQLLDRRHGRLPQQPGL